MAAPRVWQVCQLGRSLGELNSKNAPIAAFLQQVRFRKRQHVVNKKKDKPKFKPKPMVEKVVKEVKPSENWLNKKPTDDVWFKYFYPAPKYRLSEAIENHKELNSPDMLDNMDGVVFADFEINMATKKKTRFLGQFNDTVRIPHRFEDDEDKRIVAFIKSFEDQEKAKSLGAVYAGDQALIKEISTGVIEKTEFDFVICTPDMLQELATIRSIIRDRFPAVAKGNLGTDVEAMMDLFKHGKHYQSERENPNDHSRATVRLMLGPLNMPTEHLLENYQAYLTSILSYQSRVSVGRFISKVLITCPPSSEKFLLHDNELDTKNNKEESEKDVKNQDDEDDERNVAMATA